MVFPSADTWVMLFSPKDISSIVSDILTQCGDEDIEFKSKKSTEADADGISIIFKAVGFNRKDRKGGAEKRKVYCTITIFAFPLCVHGALCG
jgi:hypothetical protein